MKYNWIKFLLDFYQNMLELKIKKNKSFRTKEEKDEKTQILPWKSWNRKLELTSNEYMKLYMQNNNTHSNRESALSISKNICNILLK